MDLTPEQIANAQFVGSVRGYNREDVDAFLRGVADDYQRVLEELRGLRATTEPASVSTTTTTTTDEPEPGDTPSPDPTQEKTAMSFQAFSGDTPPTTPRTVVPDPAPEQPEVPAARVAPTVSAAAEADDAGVRALLLSADEEAWAIRDAVEDELDHNRLEVMHTMELAMRQAAELRDDARRRARGLLDSEGDVAELADTVSRQLRDADTAANEVLRSARAETRQSRRAMYERLARAEAQARAVLDEAHDQACSLLRSTR